MTALCVFCLHRYFPIVFYHDIMHAAGFAPRLNLVPLWGLIHTFIVYYNAKYNCGLTGAFRGTLAAAFKKSVLAEECRTCDAIGRVYVVVHLQRSPGVQPALFQLQCWNRCVRSAQNFRLKRGRRLGAGEPRWQAVTEGCVVGVLGPMLVANVVSVVYTQFVTLLEGVATGSGGGMLLVRLIVWPLMAEAFMAPTRMMLRSIPDDWADKYGLTFAMIPQMLVFCVIGRMFQYLITDPALMVVCNFGLFFVEMLFRLTVAHRDRAYARALACMSHAGVKQLFGQKNNARWPPYPVETRSRKKVTGAFAFHAGV